MNKINEVKTKLTDVQEITRHEAFIEKSVDSIDSDQNYHNQAYLKRG